jgi:hypothetical protein
MSAPSHSPQPLVPKLELPRLTDRRKYSPMRLEKLHNQPFGVGSVVPLNLPARRVLSSNESSFETGERV